MNSKLARFLIALLTTAMPATVHSQVRYISNDNQTITITGWDEVSGSLDIPDLIDGLPVTEIVENVFVGKPNLTSVKIPGSVTSMGSGVFRSCTSLTNVVIGDGVTDIREGMFQDCSSLATVVFGSRLTDIGAGAFAGCSNLTSMTFGKNLTTIGAWAFDKCPNLKSLHFLGDKPSLGYLALGKNGGIIYFVQGREGWGDSFAGRPTAIWKPTITPASNNKLILQATPDLTQPVWTSLATNHTIFHQNQLFYRLLVE